MQHLIVYRCLIISPSDVGAERDALEGAIRRWNSQIGDALKVRVEAVRWELHARPELGGRPQEIVNDQIVDEADLGVAVFWSRLGTPTGVHESGSVEEIEELRQKDRPVLIYFSTADVPQAVLADDQLRRVHAVKSHYQQQGLVWEFASLDELREHFTMHLTGHVNRLLMRDREGAKAPGALLTAPVPDIRLRVSAGSVYDVVGANRGKPQQVITVKVENHSSVDFFMASIGFPLDDGSGLWPQRDDVTLEPNRARRIEPGNSFSFHIVAKKLADAAKGHKIFASATDQIGREYRSQPGAVEAEIAKVLAAKKV